MDFDIPKVFTLSHLIAFGMGFVVAIIIFISLMFVGI
jgi:hypothetical protein